MEQHSVERDGIWEDDLLLPPHLFQVFCSKHSSHLLGKLCIDSKADSSVVPLGNVSMEHFASC